MTDEQRPLLDVVLVAPEIATNTGNIIRLCANTGAALHLVEPLGFSLDAARLRRAGLDYHELAEVTVHPDLATCLAELDADPTATAGTGTGTGTRTRRSRRVFALTASAGVSYDAVDYSAGDVVVFGSERSGLGEAILAGVPADRRLRIPMRPDNRSLNLANAVAVVLYEAWRQRGFTGAAGAGASSPTLAEATTSPSFDAPLPPR